MRQELFLTRGKFYGPVTAPSLTFAPQNEYPCLASIHISFVVITSLLMHFPFLFLFFVCFHL